MDCRACGFDNPEQHRFCGQCGGSLAAVCAACGFANAPGQAFCGGCGQELGQGALAADKSGPAAPPPTPSRDASPLAAPASEARRRREEARRLRAEAKEVWEAAKRWFEEQLFGAEQPSSSIL